MVNAVKKDAPFDNIASPTERADPVRKPLARVDRRDKESPPC